MRHAVIPLVTTAIFWCTVAGAQEGPEAAEIVVTAPDADAADIQSRAHDLVSAITATTVSGQVARWTEPVCLRVAGVSDATAARVRATFETVAVTAGVELGRLNCDPNILVTFTVDADALAAVVAERQPRLVRELDRSERELLLGGIRPLRWWARTSVTSSRGSRPGASSAALLNSGDYRVNSDAPVTNEYVSTLIRRPTEASLDGMSIIVDVPRAEGLSLAALSEYVAIVALTMPRMSEDFSGFDSVLALGGYRPGVGNERRLSDWDRAFLASLYSVPADRIASAQRSLVAQAMADRLDDR